MGLLPQQSKGCKWDLTGLAIHVCWPTAYPCTLPAGRRASSHEPAPQPATSQEDGMTASFVAILKVLLLRKSCFHLESGVGTVHLHPITAAAVRQLRSPERLAREPTKGPDHCSIPVGNAHGPATSLSPLLLAPICSAALLVAPCQSQGCDSNSCLLHVCTVLNAWSIISLSITNGSLLLQVLKQVVIVVVVI